MWTAPPLCQVNALPGLCGAPRAIGAGVATAATPDPPVAVAEALAIGGEAFAGEDPAQRLRIERRLDEKEAAFGHAPGDFHHRREGPLPRGQHRPHVQPRHGRRVHAGAPLRDRLRRSVLPIGAAAAAAGAGHAGADRPPFAAGLVVCHCHGLARLLSRWEKLRTAPAGGQ